MPRLRYGIRYLRLALSAQLDDITAFYLLVCLVSGKIKSTKMRLGLVSMHILSNAFI